MYTPSLDLRIFLSKTQNWSLILPKIRNTQPKQAQIWWLILPNEAECPPPSASSSFWVPPRFGPTSVPQRHTWWVETGYAVTYFSGLCGAGPLPPHASRSKRACADTFLEAGVPVAGFLGIRDEPAYTSDLHGEKELAAVARARARTHTHTHTHTHMRVRTCAWLGTRRAWPGES